MRQWLLNTKPEAESPGRNTRASPFLHLQPSPCSSSQQPTLHAFPQIEAGLRRVGVWVEDPGPAQRLTQREAKSLLSFWLPLPPTPHTRPLHPPGEGGTGPASLAVCSLLCSLLPAIHRGPGGAPPPHPSHSKHFSSELIIKPQGTCLPGLAL